MAHLAAGLPERCWHSGALKGSTIRQTAETRGGKTRNQNLAGSTPRLRAAALEDHEISVSLFGKAAIAASSRFCFAVRAFPRRLF